MFYILHNSDNFTIIDCCLSDENADGIIGELVSQSADKGVIRFISTHPDDDHIRQLDVLDRALPIRNFYCVKNAATKPDVTASFTKYCELRDDSNKAFYLYQGCTRKWMNVGSSPEDSERRGPAGLHVLWPITANPEYRAALELVKTGGRANNVSTILRYSLEEGPTILWMGDLEEAFMESIVDAVVLPRVDILFAPHHGRDMVPKKWLEQLQPKVVVIGEADPEHLERYSGYHTLRQNVAGAITFDCQTGGADVFVSESGYAVDFLENRGRSSWRGTYIGTLAL